MELKQAALDYASKGWPVFPCRTDKAPYTEHGVLEATTNAKQIHKWWTKHPKANIGVDVGGAGMLVVDLDPGYDEDALAALELPRTALVADTPRGGKHLFYALARGEVVPASQSELGDSIDVRSHHSYVLVAPSKTSDGAYTWEEQGKAHYRSNKLLEAAQRAIRERSKDHDSWIIKPDVPENVESAIAYLKGPAKIAIEGVNGDDMAYRTAAMCKSFGLSVSMAFEVMWEHWNPRCVPPWGADEIEHLERKISNAYEYNTSPPGNMTQAYKAAKAAELFKPVLRNTSGGGTETEVGRFRFVDEKGVASIPPPSWLIEDCIEQNSFSLLVAPKSTFKTFIALDMALSVATGGRAWYEDDEWQGCWPDITRAGKVLFAAGEGRSGIRARVHAWKSYHLQGEDTGNFFLVDPVPHPTEEDVTAFIEGALSLNEYYELVVIDTVGRAMQGRNENAQQDASQFTLMVQTIQKELDCAVLALHHTGHGDQERARGSTVFGTDVDSEFVLSRPEPNYLLMRNAKQKNAAEWPDAKLVHMVEHEGSLVAVSPPKGKRVDPKAAREQRPENRRGGRKRREDMEIELSVVRKAAYNAMKRYPGKEWSKSALAAAIAADEHVSVAAGTIRNTYLDELLTDKAHPVARCYDVGKQVWVYTK